MAIDSADVVIMNDDPSKIVTALTIARATRRRAIEDIVIALSVKLAIMPRISMASIRRASIFIGRMPPYPFGGDEKQTSVLIQSSFVTFDANGEKKNLWGFFSSPSLYAKTLAYAAE